MHQTVKCLGGNIIDTHKNNTYAMVLEFSFLFIMSPKFNQQSYTQEQIKYLLHYMRGNLSFDINSYSKKFLSHFHIAYQAFLVKVWLMES